jgi:F0F1-type ATP synthase assembly protein I
MDSAEASANAAASGLDRKRLNSWALFALFSALALTAHETDDNDTNAKNNVLVTTCTSMSIAFSIIAVVANIGVSSLGGLFVGTIVEGLVSLLLVGMWAGTLPVVMDPSNGLGQMYVGKSGSTVADYQSTISNANLYFTSWGCAVCALSVLAQYVRERLGGGGTGMGYTAKWYFLMLASVIVIIESMRFKNQVCSIEGGTSETTCARNTYGLITGIVGLLISFLISTFSSFGKDSALITTASSFLMAVLYTICAGLLTFENGPATYVGNHYFSAWAGFFISFIIFGSVMKEFLGVGAAPAAADSTAESDVEMDRI